jgi:flagellar basal-body rod protein FlgG
MDIVANNLANVDTAGFRRSDIAFNQFMSSEHALRRNQIEFEHLPPGSLQTFVDHTQAALRPTESPLHMAIDGEGYFTIQTPNGTAWNRDGSFTLNEIGYLSTMDGYLVMGEFGPIQLDGNNFSVSLDGDIVVENQVVNRFLIQNFDTNDVKLTGKNLFVPRDEFLDDVQAIVIEPNAVIKQGFLETSNVSIVREMVRMIAIHRQYQANERAIRTNDEALQRSVRDIAR